MNIQDFEEHFVREKAGQCAKCKLCKKIIKTHGGSTRGFHTHLKIIHKVNLLKRDVGSPTVLNSSELLQTSKPSVAINNFFKSDKMDDSLPAIFARMTACDSLSFNIICIS